MAAEGHVSATPGAPSDLSVGGEAMMRGGSTVILLTDDDLQVVDCSDYNVPVLTAG